MYKKILVATMGEYMDEILKHALNIISDKDAEVIFLYVVQTSVPFLTPKKVKEMMIVELKKRGEEILNDLEETFEQSQFSGTKFTSIMAEGNPADEIVKIANDENVDVIVMGTGKSIVDKHLLGSVSERVVHTAPCTILLVRTVN